MSGIDVNCKNNDDVTALMLAFNEKHKLHQIVAKLLQMDGINKDGIDKDEMDRFMIKYVHVELN